MRIVAVLNGSTSLCGVSAWMTALAAGLLVGCASAEGPSAGPSAGTGGASSQVGGMTGSVGPGTGGRGGSGGGGSVASGTGGAVGSTGTGGSMSGSPGIVTFRLPWTDNFDANPVNQPVTRTDNPTHWIQDPEDLTGNWAVLMDGTTKVMQEQANVSSLSRIVGGDVEWSDMKVEVRVKFSTVSSSSLALLGVRFIDFDHYYFAHLQGDGALKIRKRIAGSTTDLVTYKSNVALVPGTWYTLGFGFQGSTVTLYYNGAAVGTLAEPAASLLHGGIMLGIQNGAAAFDDVMVTPP